MVAVAPVMWALIDPTATGDPLHSLNHTSDLAHELDKNRSLPEAVMSLGSDLISLVKPPVVLAGVVGAILAWRLRGRDAVIIALLTGAGIVTYLAIAVAGLSVIPRYLAITALGSPFSPAWQSLVAPAAPRASLASPLARHCSGRRGA